MPEIFSRPAPAAFKRMASRTAPFDARKDLAPRPVLRLDETGRASAARQINHPLPDDRALENLAVPEAPRTLGSRARAGIERLARQRQGTP